MIHYPKIQTFGTVRSPNLRSVPTCEAEGVVIRPLVDLYDSKGNRIIAKLKTRDFK
jgi:hypothetical protein